jgi:hypothetical protein
MSWFAYFFRKTSASNKIWTLDLKENGIKTGIIIVQHRRREVF